MYRRRRITVGVFAIAILAIAVVGVLLIVQAVRQAEPSEPVAVEETPTAEPTAPLPTGEAASGACPTEAVQVGADVEEESYEPGDTAQLTIVVTNSHSAACMIEVGADSQTFLVRQGDETVWSSDYCRMDGDAGESALVFAAGAEKRASLGWTIEPVDENCNRGGPAFEGGTYELVTKLGDLESEPVEFEIDVPEPEPSTEESADDA